jgi:hypothetical protein
MIKNEFGLLNDEKEKQKTELKEEEDDEIKNSN